MSDTSWVTSNTLGNQGTAGSTDVVTALNGLNRLMSALIQVLQGSFVVGTFTMAAAATTTVTNSGVKSGATIVLTPTNASAGTLVGSAKSPYVPTSGIVDSTSFTVYTASGGNAAGTETFSFYAKNP
jgi:hypothetical protein